MARRGSAGSAGSAKSAGSKKSGRSRCSVGSAQSASLVAAHDERVAKAMKEGNINFLVNLLGPEHTLVNLIKTREFDKARPFVTGKPAGDGGYTPTAKVNRDDLKESAKKNCKGEKKKEESAQIMQWYDTLILQDQMKPFIEKGGELGDASKENVDGVIQSAGGEPHSINGGRGRKGGEKG